MFDATKKDTALAALGALCLKCGDKHSDELHNIRKNLRGEFS